MHRRTPRFQSSLLCAVAWLLLVLSGCSSDQSGNGGTGGATTSGGTTSAPPGTGGTTTSGGTTSAPPGTGGASSSGGTVGSGGTTGSGGQSASGGRVGSGGTATSGGAPGSGGATVPGGRTGSGGASGPGGRVGTGGSSVGGGTTGTGGATGAGTGGSTVVLNPTACSTGTAQSGDVTVTLSALQQRITGFGVSSAWAGSYRDANKDPDTLWSTTSGAGLSLLRVRIGDGKAIAVKAATYGVKVWATPWEVNSADTTAPNCPGTGSCSNPPKLKDPQDWANRLVTYINDMKTAGVNLYAISAENEPDSNGMNATTSYTAAELATWIGTYMGPAIAPTGVKIMAPETMNWYGFPGYFSAIQGNADAWKYTSILASHEYGLGPSKPEPAITSAGKEYWETEVDTGASGDADGMPSALNLAKTIHNDLTKANLNAWHYWWLYAGGSSGLFDTNTNVWTKRFWIMGNFSRFVRPGFMRVTTSGNPPSGVLVTAYTNQSDGTVAIVAINPNGSAAQLPLFISGVVPCSITPWVTSDAGNLVSGTAITVSNARFTASLAANSVTTLVGKP
jgi:glucuronoarabinoxylan endo-1,4-beta-xylanase